MFFYVKVFNLLIVCFLISLKYSPQFNSFPGVLGIRVKIMLEFDPDSRTGPKKPLPDMVTVMEPKAEDASATVPRSVEFPRPDDPPAGNAAAFTPSAQ